MKQGSRIKKEWDFISAAGMHCTLVVSCAATILDTFAAVALESEQAGGVFVEEEGWNGLPASELFIPHETVTGSDMVCFEARCLTLASVSSEQATLLAVKRSVLRQCFSQVLVNMILNAVPDASDNSPRLTAMF